MRRNVGLRIGSLLVAALAWTVPLEAQEPYSANEVMAAFLYHFGAYVQWPNPSTPDDPVTIAVLGADGIVSQLEQFLPGRTIQGRPVVVRELRTVDDLEDEELLFIGSSENGRLRELIEAVGERPVLLVTDAVDGLAEGAMINFRLVDRRVRFEISVPAAQRTGLMLSSRLLSAALRVETTLCRVCGPRPRVLASLIRDGTTVDVGSVPPRRAPRISGRAPRISGRAPRI